MWETWKERNRCIFINEEHPLMMVWARIQKSILATIKSQSWNEEDVKYNPKEQIILSSWNLNLATITPGQSLWGPHLSSPLSWSPPPHHFIKLNFDGAAKNNPGDAGYGGVFRNSTGQILRIYYGTLGISSNNAAELWALLIGLKIANQQNYSH